MPRHTRRSASIGQTLKQVTLFETLAHGCLPPTSPHHPRARAKPPSTATTSRVRKRQPDSVLSSPDAESDARRSNTGSDVDAIRLQPRLHTPDDDVKDVSPRNPSLKRRRTVASEPEDNSEDEILPIPRRKRGKNKTWSMRRAVSDSEGEDKGEEESAEGTRPQRRNLVKGVRPLTPEEEDLMGDLDEDKIIEPRMRARNKRSRYLENLEKLKRKKRGEAEKSPASGSDKEEMEIVDAGSWKPIKGARPAGSSSSAVSGESAEDEDDSFVVDDDETAVHTELPAAFRMDTHQDLSHHFKIICQLFVHLAVKPLKERDFFMEHTMRHEEYFSVPLQVMRRKLDGIRDSAVASSAWAISFKRPLGTRPNLELFQLQFSVPGCDACNLGSRVSTKLARVSGSPYDRSTFEPLLPDSSEEDVDSDTDHSVINFNLGRFCARRTKVFHEFNHWEYHLYRSLVREIELLRQRQECKNGYVRVAFAGGKEPPEDLSDADAICEWLDERGIISEEWMRIKYMMDSAWTLEARAKNEKDD